MNYLTQGQTVDAGTPLLEAWFVQQGFLLDVAALQFQIWSTGASPAQIYPATPATWQAVDVADTYPTPTTAGRIGVGHYAATWAVPGGQAIGVYELRWQYKTLAGDAFRQFSSSFEVLAPGSVTGQHGYCFVKEMRDEGLLSGQADDGRVLQGILMASRQIEDITGRWFEPRSLTLTLDGGGRRELLLQEPIVGIDTAKMTYDGNFLAQNPIDPTAYRVYARHLSDGLTSPDDRTSPKLAFVALAQLIILWGPWSEWLPGSRNVEVRGAFGYTDYDGVTPAGRTPDLIRHACKLLTLRYTTKLTLSRRGALFNQGRLIRERTRDQEAEYAKPFVTGGLTGDPEIDAILESFRRPPRMFGV